MARIRSIKPEFWTSLTIAKLSPLARLTFIGLWNYCDDHGRGLDDARLIKATVWPLDDHSSAKRIEGWLSEIETLGLIVRYEADAKRCVAVTNWTEHQRVDHPKDSLIPPPASRTSRENVAKPRESIALEGKGTGSREMEQGREHVRAPRDEELLFEALAEACDIDWHHLTPAARGALNAAVKALREAGDATPTEVGFRVRAYRLSYPTVALTPSAIAKHWPSLANGARGGRALSTADRLLIQSREMQQREEAERGTVASG